MTTKRKTKKAKSNLKTKPRITGTDSKLFASLYKAKRPLPIKKLSERADFSWKTTNDHIKKLEKMNIVKIKKTVRKTSVFIDPKFATILKKRK